MRVMKMTRAELRDRYFDGRIRRLAENLQRAKVPAEVIEAVMAGGDDMGAGVCPAVKIDWWRGVVARMDDLLDEPTRRVVRQGCACCLGGKRQERARAIARDHDTLEARIAAANESPFVFGHSVRRLDDGQIEVSFFPTGLEHHRCPCLGQANEPL